jgi:hypothetical protein
VVRLKTEYVAAIYSGLKLSASAIATQLVVSGLLFYCSVFRVIIITMSQMHHRNREG